MGKRKKKYVDPRGIYGVTPINSTAARVLGIGKKEDSNARKEKHVLIKEEIKSLRRNLGGSSSEGGKRLIEKKINKLTDRLESINKRNIERAQKAMERAKWERENYKR